MISSKYVVRSVAALLLLALSALGFAARIVSGVTCRSVTQPGNVPVGIQDEFVPDAEAIHMVMAMADVAPGTAVEAIWVSMNAISTPNYAIDSSTVVTKEGESRIHFALSRPTNGWPAGDYQVLLYVSDTFITSVPFKIASAKASPPANESRSSGAAAGGGQPSVIGCWLCESEGERSEMEFREDDVALFDGEPSRYALTDDAIQVETEFGVIDYPYKLEGNSLVLIFPGDYRIPCTRIKCEGGKRPVAEDQRGTYEQSAVPPSRQMEGSGNEHLLRGMFCHWSGSSSSYSGSSYSHSLRVSFDGQGHFATGSESSFDNPSGLGYGSGDGSGGTYSIKTCGSQSQLTPEKLSHGGYRPTACTHTRFRAVLEMPVTP